MNREQKAVVIDEIAANIQDSQAIFAVDFRGITVPQAAELRDKLRPLDASFRVVKNSLTERAADQAGVAPLKSLLAGPTALTFVRGDAATAAKAIADYARVTQKLGFKGGVMDAALLSPEEVTQISRLPSRDVLYGQFVGLVAAPLTGLVRTLNALVGGLAVALAGVLEKKESGEIPAGDPPATEATEDSAGGQPADEASPDPPASAEAGSPPAADEPPTTIADPPVADPPHPAEVAADDSPISNTDSGDAVAGTDASQADPAQADEAPAADVPTTDEP